VRWDGTLTGRTIADGTRTQAIGRRNFAHLSRYLDVIVTVTEAEIAAAVRLIAEVSRLVAEPSGALAAAAAQFHPAEAGIGNAEGTVVAVVSGGNVEPERYRALLASPLPADVSPA
ncbi:MAG TPA: pyridoxal-phosphate dependent enzyme, partial [Candidatus Deferrimicrobiaceae bacterium]|nr:pyridoxal-phosphate dependent enzyme [Candidatus Deferrimicrobiaceae bacterium]